MWKNEVAENLVIFSQSINSLHYSVSKIMILHGVQFCN